MFPLVIILCLYSNAASQVDTKSEWGSTVHEASVVIGQTPEHNLNHVAELFDTHLSENDVEYSAV